MRPPGQDHQPASKAGPDGGSYSEYPSGAPDSTASPLSAQKVREAVSKLLQGKEKEWTAVAQKNGPLTLLDLPVDILQEIVKEVTHTNDLAALALTHSALHSLAIPQIYSRFDIVWPDSNAQSEPRAGVDALTYGLATLVMAEDVFKGTTRHQQPQSTTTKCCAHCGQASSNPQPSQPTENAVLQSSKRRRRGNYYAEFTRKFSLGNGPADWVQEYMVTREGGKMLGTLVALAVARMRRLETFVWDMPTGILQDVWDALASLGEHTDGQPCRLEKVWVRWHNSSKVDNNYEAPIPPPRNQFTFWEPYSSSIDGPVPDRYLSKRNRVERPTFSALPPLKSLSVLDIDECAYLDEMSQLIGRSKHSLRELRVGIAEHAVTCEWAHPWEGAELSQHPKDRSVLGTSHWERRLGGVVGVLVGHVYDLRHNLEISRTADVEHQGVQQQLDGEGGVSSAVPSSPIVARAQHSSATAARGDEERSKRITPKFIEHLQPSSKSLEDVAPEHRPHEHMAEKKGNLNGNAIDGKLSLEILELERVALSTTFLAAAFDWYTIRDLTILNCPGHAALWTFLRREYCASGDKKPPQGGLRIRKIHTNTCTPQLINLIKDLEPNTLEVLFLQQSPYHKSTVSISSIMRAVRHHRGSLKKLLIDSRQHEVFRGDLSIVGWQRWMLNREMVHFISSGRMPKLRELAVAIDHKDWHHFLQRLPRMPHLRSVNLPYIECEEGKLLESGSARERALQIVDIITLRPDIELCYLGIMGKCFEILESRVGRGGWRADDADKQEHGTTHEGDDDDAEGHEDHVDDDDDVESEAAEAADEVDEEGEGDDGDAAHDDDEDDDHDPDETDDERERSDDDHDSDGEAGGSPGRNKTTLRFDVREILFYDDKVAIFKARHGRL